MKKIEASVFSHLSIIQLLQGKQVTKSKMSAVGNSTPLDVSRFEELVEHIAKIHNYNNQYCLFYRGQDKEHRIGTLTTVFPKIYRNHINHTVLTNRFTVLESLTKKLLTILQGHHQISKIIGLKRLKKYHELAWSILQHYEICPTPVLDITLSIRVSSSFSLIKDRNTQRDEGILYVLAFPHIKENISFHVEEELFNIKLLGVCPPEAKRPFYQEGFGAGTFPRYDTTSNITKFDFRHRLIAKFRLINNNNTFFGRGFDIIPYDSLYPNKLDSFYELLQTLRDDPEVKDLL